MSSPSCLMSEPASASRSRRSWPLHAGAALTVAVTVVADLVAGSHLAHVATLGALAAFLGGARVHYAGRHRIHFAALSIIVALQPTAHAASSVATCLTGLLATDADDLISFVQAGIVVLIVSAVGAAEAVLDVAAAGVGGRLTTLRALVGAVVEGRSTPVPRYGGDLARRRAGDTAPSQRRRTWVRHDPRRGPPTALSAA